MLATAILLSGCAQRISEPQVLGKPCPPLREWTQDEQNEALIEYMTLMQAYDPCVLCQMLDQYSLLREQCR